jgi:hypothetical protein
MIVKTFVQIQSHFDIPALDMIKLEIITRFSDRINTSNHCSCKSTTQYRLDKTQNELRVRCLSSLPVHFCAMGSHRMRPR